MVTLSAFKDGFTALRANPILLVGGLLVGGGSQLKYAGRLIDSPLLSAGLSLVWLLIFPFVLGGFIGAARAAVDGTGASVLGFVAAARSYYVPLLLAMLLFVFLVFGVATGLGVIGFVLGIGSVALAAINDTAAFVAGVGSMLIWLVSILVLIMFIQFYDTAIVIENQSVTDAFRRSITLVRANLKSVGAFSLAWITLVNVFLIPEYVLRLTLTDAGPVGVLPIDSGIPVAVLFVLGLGVSAAGFAYFYTVYTAYYLRLVAASPAPTEPA